MEKREKIKIDENFSFFEQFTPLQDLHKFLLDVQNKLKFPLQIASPLRMSDSDQHNELRQDQIQEIQNKYLIFNDITKDFQLAEAREASQRERKNKDLSNHHSFIYGQSHFMAFANIFAQIKQFGGLKESGGIFYDLGSGSGKSVLAASLLHPFDQCKGIEFLQSLYKMSLELKLTYQKSHEIIREKFEEFKFEDFKEKNPPTFINFIQADITDYDWKDGDIFYACSTCYESGLMRKMRDISQMCQKNSFFVTLTQQLDDNRNWKLLEQISNQSMSWGIATAYIYQQITEPESFSDDSTIEDQDDTQNEV